jgi:hypothetical protein
MSQKPSKFRKTDVTRAVKAMEAAGLKVARVEFDKDGRFSVVTIVESKTHPEQELEKWIARNARFA